MAKYRSTLGKVVDMSVLQAKYEKTRAVGNMSVNARGDTIDATGKIIKPVTAKVNENYANTVGNRAAQPVKKQPRKGDEVSRTPVVNKRVPIKPAEPPEEIMLTEAERELEEYLEDDVTVEEIKSKELGK